MLPETVVREARWLRLHGNLAALAVRRVLRKRGAISGMLDFAAPAVVTTITGLQKVAAKRAQQGTPRIMESTSNESLPDPSYEADADQFAGTLGSGLSVEAGVTGVFRHARQIHEQDEDTEVLRRYLEPQIERMARTAVADTYRSVAEVTARSRWPKGHYVRALTPPSCGRCVILAGMRSSSKPFQRHPNCDCIAVWMPDEPVDDAVDVDVATTDPTLYLSQLSDREAAKVLGSKANVQAFRDGADPIQLVNAYRKKGYVYAAARGQKYTHLNGFESREHMVAAGMGYWDRTHPRVTAPRMMPETIYQIARNPDQAKQMLYDYGWIRNVYNPLTDRWEKPF